MVPLAAELKEWLGQRRSHYRSKADDSVELPYSNPYTFHASSIAASLIHIVNSATAFAELTEPMLPFRAEVTRLRLRTGGTYYSSSLEARNMSAKPASATRAERSLGNVSPSPRKNANSSGATTGGA